MLFPILMALAADCDPKLLERDNVTAFLEKHSVRSVSEVLQALPECYRANHVAIHHSASLQCATPKAPRMVIYLPESLGGTTRCSFNSGQREDYEEFYRRDPGIDCHENTLECERFVGGAEARFEYYEVQFSHDDDGKPHDPKAVHNAPKTYTVSTANPPQCMTACHRGLGANPDPRPAFEIYPQWPGFYGAFHDELFKGRGDPVESRNFVQQYLAHKPRNARYRQLPELIDADLKTLPRPEHVRGKPVIDLHNELEAQNYQRVARKLTNRETLEKIWPYRYAFIGALACSDEGRHVRREFDDPAKPDETTRFPMDSFLPPEVRNHFALSYVKVASDALIQHQGNLQHQAELQEKAEGVLRDEVRADLKAALANDPKTPPATWSLSVQDDFFNPVRLAYLARNLGLPTADWSMTFRETLEFGAGSHNPQQILDHLIPKLLKESERDLVPADPRRGVVYVDKCKRLRDKSLAALRAAKLSFPAAPSPAVETTAAKGEKCDLPAAPATNAHCVRCHVHGDERRFPFDQPETLSARLREPTGKYNARSLLAEITEQVNSGRMPYHVKTSDGEKRELVAYFTAVAAASCGQAAGDRKHPSKGGH